MKPLRKAGPCPDPDNYIWVRRRNGGYWRRRRGSLKPAVLNEVCAANASNTKQTMPAARRLLGRLNSYTDNFARDYRLQRVATLFSRDLSETGEMTYRLFDRFEMQRDHPLQNIYVTNPGISISKKTIEVTIDLKGEPVRQKTPGASHYYFELILLSGDPAKENALRVESDSSTLYEFEREYTDKIKLSIQLPEKKPYLVFLKCGCMERKNPAMHAKNYGMKVVGLG